MYTESISFFHRFIGGVAGGWAVRSCRIPSDQFLRRATTRDPLQVPLARIEETQFVTVLEGKIIRILIFWYDMTILMCQIFQHEAQKHTKTHRDRTGRKHTSLDRKGKHFEHMTSRYETSTGRTTKFWKFFKLSNQSFLGFPDSCNKNTQFLPQRT